MAGPHKIMSKPLVAQWLGLGVALFVLLAIIAVNLYRDHGRTARREQERLSTQARVVAENIQFQLSTIDLALERVLKDIADDDRLLVANEAAQPAYLAALIDAIPGIRTIGILDVDGTMLAANRKELIGKNLAFRDYVSTVRRNPNVDTLYISPPFRSMFNPYILNITRVIPGPSGEFAGMVSITLDPEYFSTLMASVLYVPGMWDALVHADGDVFLTEPKQHALTEKNLAHPDSLFIQHRDGGELSTVLTGHIPAVKAKQMVAQRSINPPRLKMDKQLVIAVGRNLDDVFALWRHDLVFRMVFFVLVSTLACLLLAGYHRAQRRFDRATASSAANLRATQENFQLIVENTVDLVVKMDVKGCFTYLNPAFCELFGATRQQQLGRHYGQEVVAADRSAIDDYFASLFRPPYTTSFTQREKTVLGVRYLQWTAKGLFDQDGAVTEIIAIGRDVTEHMHRIGALEDQAHRDFLTGLANRRHFMALGEGELQRAQRYGQPLALLMLDIDHFKHINDAYGHRVGDIVLQAFSKTLLKTVRTIDIIGRMGGEEFAVLLPETSLHDAVDAAQRLKDAVAANKIALESGVALGLTVSIGVAAKQEESSLDIMLDLADSALYQAKQTGRNKVCFAQEPLLEALDQVRSA